MPDDERRSARRARLSGIRVAYEISTGERREADAVNLSREGLFIASTTPLATGKRLTLEIQAAGEAAPWAALGRVVWNREVSAGDGLPAGMAVKFIDVEDSVVSAIERLIEARERTEPGLGEGAEAPADRAPPPRREPPRRERTMLGVGIASVSAPVAPTTTATPAVAAPSPAVPAAPTPPAATPVARAMPSRERTIVGVGLGGAAGDPREPSLAIDLVAKKPPSTRPPSAPDEASWAASDTASTAIAMETPPSRTTADAAPAATVTETAPSSAAYDTAPAASAVDTPGATDAGPATGRRASPAREPERIELPVEREFSDAPLPKRRSGIGWLVLLLLIAGGGAGYAFRDRLLPFWYTAVNAIDRRLH